MRPHPAALPAPALASAALALALVLAAAPGAGAHIYKCQKDGREWIQNYKEPGVRCSVVMMTSDPEPSPGAPGGRAAGSKAGRAFAPPAVGDAPRPTEEPGTVRERMRLYEPYIDEAAARYQVPAAFIKAIMRVESSFRYEAVSSAGAQGLMQLMPGTARAMGVADAFDPRQNIMGGARLLRVLANRYEGDFVKVLSAYHAGSGAVADKGGIPYEGTEGYVRAVLDHYYRYRALDQG